MTFAREKAFWIAIALMLLAGVSMRTDLMSFRSHAMGVDQFQQPKLGYDEFYHVLFVATLAQQGVTAMPSITRAYIEEMTASGAVRKQKLFYPHPLRFLHPWTGSLVHRITGLDFYKSLRLVSAAASILIFALTSGLALRWFGRREALGVAALMAFAPTQLYLAQYGLAEGIFVFWAMVALGSLWESLQKPTSRFWPLLLGVAMACLILTKENAAFVNFGIGVILLLARPLGLGVVGRPLFYSAFAGGVAGILTLVWLAGGFEPFFTTYFIAVSGIHATPFMQYTNEGPWYRYLIDYLAVSPLVLLLAIGLLFHGVTERKGWMYLGVFVGATYLGMCATFKDLRYTIIWDFPLRCLALGQIGLIASRFNTRATVALIAILAALVCFDLHQFQVFFLDGQVYEPVTINLFRAIDMLKDR